MLANQSTYITRDSFLKQFITLAVKIMNKPALVLHGFDHLFVTTVLALLGFKPTERCSCNFLFSRIKN